MHLEDHEHINPFDENNPDFWMKIEHLARYLFAAYFLEKNHVKGNHLDLGCADGYGLSELKTTVQGQLVGVDYDKELLKSSSYPSVTLIHADLDKQKINNICADHAPFTSVTAFEVLEHLDNPGDVLKDLTKSMSKSGYLLASLPNPHFESMDENGTPASPHHHHAFTMEQGRELFEKSGFRVQDILGQSLSNRLFSRERNLVEAGILPHKPFTEAVFQKEDMMHHMAHLLAWPFKQEMEYSYSFVYVCRKA